MFRKLRPHCPCKMLVSPSRSKYIKSYWDPLFSALPLLETDLHVHGLVLRVQRFMNADRPLDAAGNELPGIVQKFLGVVGVIGLTFAQSPGFLHAIFGLGVEACDLQLSHLVLVAFDDV